MKGALRLISMLLVLLLTFSVSALAAEEPILANSRAKIEVQDEDATVTFASASDDEEKILVTYENADAITEGGYYLILALAGDGTAINKDTILYINQVTADNEQSISFEVYPSKLKDSVILITGVNVTVTEGKIGLEVALVDALYIIGDLNGDSGVNTQDVILFRQYLAGLISVSQFDSEAADINQDDSINTQDIIIMNQYFAGLIDSLN